MSDDEPTQLNVTVPRSLKVAIQHLALDQGRSMSDLVTEVLQDYADKQKK